MFYRIYRKATAVFIAFLSLVMAVVFVFQYFLPDRFYVSGSELDFSSSYGKIISFDTNYGKAKEVLSRNDNSFSAKAKLLGILPLKEVSVTVSDEKIVTVCGTPFGVKMFTDGVLVVDFSEIETENGRRCPASESGLLEGDLIKAINKTDVFRNEDVAEIIEKSEGKELSFSILRNGKSMEISLIPEMLKDQSGYKAGFWVRDSSAGIGTLTFYDPEDLSFAGLGHAVCDIDTGTVLPFSSGEIVPAAITKIKKGVSGTPGELGGAFIGKDDLGIVKINNETGLYGTLEYTIEGIEMPVAHKQDIYEGSAVILSTVEGTEAEEYDILIEKIALSDDSLTKNMVIKVVDEELIEATGGIVQGMSGSPIIQDGKLIGAVTHVLVNDPTKGYGIFAENMLEMSKKCG
ncbi:MAG: SpoIVB peptidase [Oscillospiraceae bacterium]|nr:SpoIVB peptidase [Oscillospiraceae bacterium]MBQ5322931.1 SpoIVB peptidase [Oscillospiraceae bacterium]